MRGGSGACVAGACMAGEHAWWGAWHGVCVHGRGHAWWGACAGRGHAWQERRPLQWTVPNLLECIIVQIFNNSMVCGGFN